MSDDELIDLALQLADGEPIDWGAASERLDVAPACLEAMQKLESLARIHQEPGTKPSIHDSIRDGNGSDDDVVTWGPFQILEKVGRGSYGDVYRARDPRLGREVALKLLRLRRDDRSGEAGLVHEGYLLARVRHPNVVNVYGAECIGDRAGVWMEFVHGETLEQQVERRGPLPWREVAEIGVALAEALAAVHRAGLLHRDIKAQNVMREPGGRVVLMDFGAGHDTYHDAGTALAGTPAYLAPEVLAGGPPSVRSDVYALGVVLYWLATGAFPVAAETIEALRLEHAQGPRRNARAMRPLPRALASIIGRATADDPACRYDTAERLESVLRRAANAPRRRRRAILAAAVTVTLAAAGIVVWNGIAKPMAHERLAFAPRDLVLIARFENTTGEPVLDGAIEYALERELLSSRVVGLVPVQRVHDALVLMKRPLDTVVDGDVAREVAIRDGGIKAVLGGRVAKAADRYVLTAQLINPHDGAIVATEIEEAEGQSDVVTALRRLAYRVRTALGERVPALPASRAAQEPATTRSLAAFQLFNRAHQLGRDGQWPASLELARQVVREDPQFGSGWIWLAWTLRMQPGAPRRLPAAELTAAAERAMALTDGVPGWERLWIQGSYHFLTLNYAAAIAPFQALLSLRPDHYYGAARLHEALLIEGQRGQASSLFARIAELRPLDPDANVRAAGSLLAATRNEDAARPYVERTRTIIKAAAGSYDHSSPALWVDLFDAYSDWRRRDTPSAVRRIDAIVDRYLHGPRHEAAVFAAGNFFLGLGKIDRGEAVLLMRKDPWFRELHTASIPAMRGDRREAVARLGRLQRRPDYRPRLLSYLENGLVDDARRLLAVEGARTPTQSLEAAFTTIARGRLALIDGELEQAARLLSEGLKKLPGATNSGEYHTTCAYLADALTRLGRPEEAIAQLETCVAPEPFLQEPASGFFNPTRWLGTRLTLADEYRKRGRIPDALALEADIRRLLAVADPDHPLVQRLNARK